MPWMIQFSSHLRLAFAGIRQYAAGILCNVRALRGSRKAVCKAYGQHSLCVSDTNSHDWLFRGREEYNFMLR